MVRVVVVIAAILLTSCMTDRATFSLINKSKEPIARAFVTVCGQSVELSNVRVDESAVGSYEVYSDSHYSIQIEFISGRKLKKDIGYVTNGTNFRDEITVSDSDIEITDRKLR